jgi:hypothetical protein
MFSEERYVKGKAAEEKVGPYVTKYFNVYPTADRMDHFDYRSKDLVIEQKARFKGDSSLKFWRFPVSKLFHLQNEGDRSFVLLYYWVKENRLFYIQYNKHIFEHLYISPDMENPDVPNWMIPKRMWVEIELSLDSSETYNPNRNLAYLSSFLLEHSEDQDMFDKPFQKLPELIDLS